MTAYKVHAWSELAGHPLSDWKYEVANDDTRLGYLDWCRARIENDGGEWPYGSTYPWDLS